MEEDALMAEVLRALEIDHQYVRVFHAGQHHEIQQLRSVGRRAARQLRWKVRTFQTDPALREDHMVAVWVVITSSDSDEDDRLRTRSEMQFRNIDW